MTGRLWILRSRRLHCQVTLGHHFSVQWPEVSWVTVCRRPCERPVVVCMTVKLRQLMWKYVSVEEGVMSPHKG